jgi:hypothetical protein
VRQFALVPLPSAFIIDSFYTSIVYCIVEVHGNTMPRLGMGLRPRIPVIEVDALTTRHAHGKVKATVPYVSVTANSSLETRFAFVLPQRWQQAESADCNYAPIASEVENWQHLNRRTPKQHTDAEHWNIQSERSL